MPVDLKLPAGRDFVDLDSRWSSTDSARSSSSPSPSLLPSTTTTTSISTSTLASTTIATLITSSTSPQMESGGNGSATGSSTRPRHHRTLAEYIATTKKDLASALELIATSIAEKRQITNCDIIHSPPFTIVLLMSLGIVGSGMAYLGMDWISMALTAMAICAGLLRIVDYLTVGFIDAAERIGWEWLYEMGEGTDADESEDEDNDDDDDDAAKINIVWVTRLNDAIIGALVLRILPARSREEKRIPLIRAWAVYEPIRGATIGLSLLRLAIDHCQTKGWSDPVFASDQAHSVRILPGLDWMLGAGERRARKTLEREIARAREKSF